MKTSKILVVAIVLSGLILISALGIGLYTSNVIKNRTAEVNRAQHNEYAYHVMMIINEDDEAYSNDFFERLEATALINNIAIERVNIGNGNYREEVLDRMDMAMYAKVDGIIVHAYDDVALIDKIDQATEMNIPVVTLNKNLLQSKQISYAGINRYNIGLNLGKTIAELTSHSNKIAIIDKTSYQTSDVYPQEDRLLLGLREILDTHERLSIELTKSTEEGVLSAETIATEIIDDYPSINGIVCIDTQSTLGIVQVLIDRNKVNDFLVIGFGDDEEILQYIRNGVIHATIVTDDASVGEAALTSLYTYLDSGITTPEFSASFVIVDEKNLEKYLSEKESANEN